MIQGEDLSLDQGACPRHSSQAQKRVEALERVNRSGNLFSGLGCHGNQRLIYRSSEAEVSPLRCSRLTH